jgi:hypothetical protein
MPVRVTSFGVPVALSVATQPPNQPLLLFALAVWGCAGILDFAWAFALPACGVQGVQAPWRGFGGGAPNSMLFGRAAGAPFLPFTGRFFELSTGPASVFSMSCVFLCSARAILIKRRREKREIQLEKREIQLEKREIQLEKREIQLEKREKNSLTTRRKKREIQLEKRE